MLVKKSSFAVARRYRPQAFKVMAIWIFLAAVLCLQSQIILCLSRVKIQCNSLFWGALLNKVSRRLPEVELVFGGSLMIN